MKVKSLLKTMLLLCMVMVGGSAWGAETITYTFTSKSWEATAGGSAANWTSGKAGDQMQSGRGVQVTTGTSGANATSPSSFTNISKIVVTYSTNASKGAGSISFKVGSNTAVSKSVTKTGGTSDRTLEYDFDPNQTGSVLMTVTCTTNSIYVKSVAITYNPIIKITDISLPATETVGVGGEVELSPTLTPANASETVVWESSNTDIATVAAGVVTGVAAGEVTITAKSPSDATIKAECTVTVTAAVPVTGVALNKTATTLEVSGQETLTATVSPDDATNKNVTWTSNNEEVATVADGVVTAVATGSATITATTVDGGFTAQCVVTVKAKLDAPTITAPTYVYTEGETAITITASDGASIYYTTNGDDPTSASTLYAGSFNVNVADGSPVTIKAIAVQEGKIDSDVASATVTYKAQPTQFDITLNDGTFGTSYGGSASGITDETPVVTTVENTTVTYAGGGNHYINENEIRFYPSNKLTFTAPSGYKITRIVFTASEWGCTVKVGETSITSSTKTWEGSESSVLFEGSGSGKCVITKAAITLVKMLPAIATDVTITNPGVLAKDATGTFAATSTDAAGCTKAWSSSNSSVINITDASTGAYTAAGRGIATITLTITPADPTSYREVSAEREISVTAPVEVLADDVTMTYGDDAKAIATVTSDGYAGTLSYVSNNTAVATVDASGNVTAVAAGTTTITISSPADAVNLYTAGEDVTINVTVNNPTGAEESTLEYVYYEELTGNGTSLPDDWTSDGSIWTAENSYGAVANNGTNGETYDLVTCEYDMSGYTGIGLDFDHTGKTFSTPSNACNVYVKEGVNEPVQLSIEYFTGDNWTWKEVRDIDLSAYDGKNIKIIFRYTPVSGDAGKWQVKNFGLYGSPAANVTIAASKYGTYCFKYPLNIPADNENYKAYIVTNVEGSTVTFTQISGEIKGGVPFILYGTPGNYTIPAAEASTTVPAGNQLEGTLAPTYVQSDEDFTNFGLSGGEFKKINAGTIPANKAYLPVLTANVPSADARLTIVFEDEATGIKSMEVSDKFIDGTVYNLRGQRVENPTKGLYIVNGKKMYVK